MQNNEDADYWRARHEEQQRDDREQQQQLVDRLFNLDTADVITSFDNYQLSEAPYLSIKTCFRAAKSLFIHLYAVVRFAQPFLNLSRDRIDNTEYRWNFPEYAEFTLFSIVHQEEKIFNYHQTDNLSFIKHSLTPFVYKNVQDFFALYEDYRNSYASFTDALRKIKRKLKELDYCLAGILYLFRYLWQIRSIVRDIERQAPEFKSKCHDWLISYIDVECVATIEDVFMLLQTKMKDNFIEPVPYIVPNLDIQQPPSQSFKFYFEDVEKGTALTDSDGDPLLTIYKVHRIVKDGRFITSHLPPGYV